MKFISKSDSQEWCEKQSISLGNNGLLSLDKNNLISFKIPSDTGQRIAKVKEQFGQFENEKEILIWLTDWDIFPSASRMHIFERFRSSYGENRKLIDSPGHIFNENELEDALSLVILAVLFLWDCYILNTRGDKILFYSHDESGLINK